MNPIIIITYAFLPFSLARSECCFWERTKWWTIFLTTFCPACHFQKGKTEMSTTLRWIIFQPLKLLRTGVLLGQLECSHLTPMAGSFSFISFHFISWRQHQWWISYFLYLKFNNSFPPPTCKWRQKRWSGPGGCFLLLINFGFWWEGRRGHSVVLSTSIPHGFCIVA